MLKVAVFWEDWFSNIYPFSQIKDVSIIGSTIFLGELLKKYHFNVMFYCLGTTVKKYPATFEYIQNHFEIGSHGKEHIDFPWIDKNYIAPNAWLGFTGGFWFRVLPLWLLKIIVKRANFFYIHPYDIDENHPKLKNPWFNFKRRVGLKGCRNKLEKLLEYCSH